MASYKTNIIVLILIALLCSIFYSNSLDNPFIWDDEALIVKNALIRSWENLPQAFTTDLYSGVAFGSNFYRPMQAVTYIWDYHFWKLNPFGYHITNLILQTLVAFMVFLFSRLLLKETKVAFATALLFALSPLHTEAVTYISGRADMLMGLFLLSSFFLFAKGRNVFSWFLFILGLLSKELAVVFPLVIAAYLFYCRPKELLQKKKNIFNLVLPFILIDIIYIILRLGLLNFSRSHPAALTKYPLILRITVLPEAVFTYLKLLLMPVNLHMSWTLRRPTGYPEIFINWFVLGMFCVACAHILKSKKISRAGKFILSWALIFFIPQSGILPINAFLAEHFIYLPSIGFFMFLSFCLNKYLKNSVFIFSIAGLIFFYGMLTSVRNMDWKDPVVFYKKIIKFSPDSFQAHNNLGLQYEQRYLYKEAINEYKRALEIDPNLIEARSNLANVYFKSGNYSQAKEEYALVQKNVPVNKAGELQNNIGCIYEVEGLLDKAMESYKLALRLDPSLRFTHFNMAKIYATKGEFDLAVRQILESIPEAGIESSLRDQYTAVVNEFIKSKKVRFWAPSFYNELGVTFAKRNLNKGAIIAFKRVIELEPFYDDAHYNLGLVYWKNGQKNEAKFELETVLRINPNHLEAKSFLQKIIYKK